MNSRISTIPDQATFPTDLTNRPTAELVDLEASGEFALSSNWGDALFYGAVCWAGGMGDPIFSLHGSDPLKLDTFQCPPLPGEPSPGASGLRWEQAAGTRGLMISYRLDEVWHIAEARIDAITSGNSLAQPVKMPSLLLIAVRARVVPMSGINSSLLGGLRQNYLQVEIKQVLDVRAFWITL